MTDTLETTTTATYWPVGQKFRITNDVGGHEFDDDTIVTACVNPNDEQGWPRTGGDLVLATTRHEDADRLSVDNHDVGTTAWVDPLGVDDEINCVPITVRRCTYDGHRTTPHHHSRMNTDPEGEYPRGGSILWSTPRANGPTRLTDEHGQQVVFDKTMHVSPEAEPVAAPEVLRTPPARVQERRDSAAARRMAVTTGRTFRTARNRTDRRVPNEPLWVRIVTPATREERLHDVEGWLWQVDDTDVTCTFLVLVPNEGGGPIRDEDMQYVLPADVRENRFAIEWVYAVEVVEAEEPLVHGSRPEWPIYRCTESHRYAAHPHYHVTGTSAEVMHNPTVHESAEMHTVPRARFDTEGDYPEWQPGVTYVTDAEPETVAEHHSTPSWPVRLCTQGHPGEVHYHVTRGGDAFNPAERIMWNTSVHEADGFHTEQGFRYGGSEHVTETAYTQPHPEAHRRTDATTYRAGVRYRVTSAAGGHNFPVGTIVTSLDSGQYRLPTFHATTEPVEAPWADLTQHLGTTAWVIGPNVGSYDSPNVEVVDAPGAAQNCDEGHKPEPHSHWVLDGDKVYAMPVDFQPAPAVAQFWSQPEPGAVFTTIDDSQRSEPETRDTGPSLPDSLTPEEVARRLRAREGIEEGLRRRDAQPIEDLLADVQQTRALRDEARVERGTWINEAILTSRRYAESARWCGVYDRTMEELGLPNRHADLNSRPGVDYEVDPDFEPDDAEPETEEINVTARAEVQYDFDDSDFDDWFEGRFGVSVSSNSNSTTFTWSIDLDATITVDEGACGCHDVDWDEHMPDWVSDSGADVTIENRSCSND